MQIIMMVIIMIIIINFPEISAKIKRVWNQFIFWTIQQSAKLNEHPAWNRIWSFCRWCCTSSSFQHTLHAFWKVCGTDCSCECQSSVPVQKRNTKLYFFLDCRMLPFRHCTTILCPADLTKLRLFGTVGFCRAHNPFLMCQIMIRFRSILWFC